MKALTRLSPKRMVIAFIVAVNLMTGTVATHAEPRSTITFENRSGEYALVKVVGKESRKAVAEAEVANEGSSTVHVGPGNYYLLTRYGTPGHYRVAKGDPFDVTEVGNQYSEISITLHPVVRGNYATHPVTLAEFEKAGTAGSTGFTISPPTTATSVPLGLKPLELPLKQEPIYIPPKIESLQEFDPIYIPPKLEPIQKYEPMNVQPATRSTIRFENQSGEYVL